MFRFTIRELVLLTLVVALGVGWWMERTRVRSLDLGLRYLTALVRALESDGYRVYLGEEVSVERDGKCISHKIEAPP